jgi:hypothetical protein
MSRVCRSLFIMLVLISNGVLASAGGQDIGGGNGTKSSLAEVDECVVGPKWADMCENERLGILKLLFHSLDENSPLPIHDSRARHILTTMSQKLVPFLTSDQYPNSRVKIDILRNGPCMENGKPHDASMRVSGHDDSLIAHLCISESRLQRYPTEALQTQVPALFAHEFAHAAGLGESDAVYLQKYILERWNVSCSVHFAGDYENGGDIHFIAERSGTAIADVGQYISAPHPNETRSNRIETTTWEQPYDFQLKFTVESGSLKFQSLDMNGTYIMHEIKWAQGAGAGVGGSLELVNGVPTDSKSTTVTGRPFKPTFVQLTNCFLR